MTFPWCAPYIVFYKNVKVNRKFGRIWVERYVNVLCSTEKNGELNLG
jgi:hypothetical protein